nr:zinc finger protein Gfi-1b-like [Aedes albopictus]
MMITSDAESLGTQQVQDFPTIAAPSTTSTCNETTVPSDVAEPASEMTCAEYDSSVQLTFDDLVTLDPSSDYSMPSSSYAQVLSLPFCNQEATHPTLATPTVLQAIEPSVSHVQVPAPKKTIQKKKSPNSTRPFRCTICGKSYLTEQDMLDHRRNHDPSMKPYKCQCCENSYRYAYDLDRHFKKQHGTMTYVCVIEGCPKAFTRRDRLKIHIKWHEGRIKRQRELDEWVMSQNERFENRKERED